MTDDGTGDEAEDRAGSAERADDPSPDRGVSPSDDEPGGGGEDRNADVDTTEDSAVAGRPGAEAPAVPRRATTDKANEGSEEATVGEGSTDPPSEPGNQDDDGSGETDRDGGVRAVTASPDRVDGDRSGGADVPGDVRSYDRFTKVDRASYDRVNEFLRDRTYVTAREWAIARLCADFRTATGVEMTKIGEHLPELVPFMTDTYSPQAVNQARSAFEQKVRMAGSTFLYGAMSGFFTADELDDLMYEVTEVAKFLLEVEGVELTVDEELDAEDRISAVMREVRRASEELRYDEVACPHCGEAYRPDVAED